VGIAHLVDHRVLCWRPADPPLRDELGDIVEAFDAVPVPDGLNARPNQQWSGTLQDPGPGEQQAAMRQWFLVLGFDARERDVLEVESGPEVGKLLRVESVTKPTNPFAVHHLEVNVSVWHGSVDEDES
jgi:hypothetical protein